MAKAPRKSKRLAKGKPLRLTGPLTAAVAAGVVLFAGLLQGGLARLDAGRAPNDGMVIINLPADARQHIDNWPKFFACYSLAAEDADVAAATMRANDFPRVTFPTGEIRVVLKSTGGERTEQEREVLRQADALIDRRIREGGSCLD